MKKGIVTQKHKGMILLSAFCFAKPSFGSNLDYLEHVVYKLLNTISVLGPLIWYSQIEGLESFSYVKIVRVARCSFGWRSANEWQIKQAAFWTTTVDLAPAINIVWLTASCMKPFRWRQVRAICWRITHKEWWLGAVYLKMNTSASLYKEESVRVFWRRCFNHNTTINGVI